jgi:hypothetical protein
VLNTYFTPVNPVANAVAWIGNASAA